MRPPKAVSEVASATDTNGEFNHLNADLVVPVGSQFYLFMQQLRLAVEPTALAFLLDLPAPYLLEHR
jgi:hypothetical protein